MRFARKHRATGGIDGGEGRGVQMGGSDPAAPPSGIRRRKADEIDEDDALIEESRGELDDFEEFDDSGDASPGDRRRDPLRRPI